MKTAVLYLDVDGVLNVIGSGEKSPWRESLRRRHAVLKGVRYRLLLSREMARAIQALDAEIRWATTWGHDANEHISTMLGFPDFPVAADPEERPYSPNFKLKAIQREVERERRPFIWIDDECIDEEVEEWASECGVQCLLLKPLEEEGITPEMLVGIETFIASLRQEVQEA